MSIRKDLKAIKEELSNMNSSAIIDKAKKYDELISYLADIKFDVESVKTAYDDNGTCFVIVNYKIPSVKLYVNEDGSTIPNNRFKAINMLNLISFEEMSKIAAYIEEAKIKNK